MNSYENPQLSYECDLTAERDKLREVNAELVKALRIAARALSGMYPWPIDGKFSQKEARETAARYVVEALSKVST